MKLLTAHDDGGDDPVLVNHHLSRWRIAAVAELPQLHVTRKEFDALVEKDCSTL
jgi:hypothetical protein